MPTDFKAEIEEDASSLAGGPARRGPWASVPGPAAARLRLPVTGMEAEFNVFLDGVEIDPREFWGHPTAFIERPLLRREKSSFQLPTGGAVYFDRGVIEVVTPVIELAPGCSPAAAHPQVKIASTQSRDIGGLLDPTVILIHKCLPDANS